MLVATSAPCVRHLLLRWSILLQAARLSLVESGWIVRLSWPKVLQAYLYRLHVAEELVQAHHVQLGLEVDFLGDFLDLWQV